MSAKGQKAGDLEVDEDLKFQRVEWRIQRIGWVLMLLFILAALAGAFGRGPLSRRTDQSPDNSLAIDFDRFGRLHAQTDIKLVASEESAREGALRIWLDRDYMTKFETKEINPQPERIDLSPDRMTLVYRVPKSPGSLKVNLILEPNEMGSVRGAAGVEGKQSLFFSQFIYP